MDEWITREWENKSTKRSYSSSRNQYQSMNRYSNLKPAYLVRYADDWILLTNTKENALKWKERISKYLSTTLKLELSKEKTLITNIKRKPIHFLGFTYKVVREGTKMRGYKPVTKPQQDRLDRKMNEICDDIRLLSLAMPKEETVEKISLINAKIRGIINYYSAASQVNLALGKYDYRMTKLALHCLKRKGVELVRANEVSNLISLHENYRTQIAAIKICDDKWVGITSPAFCKYTKTYSKNPDETPYTAKGRALHHKRTRKQMTLPRMEEILQSQKLSTLIRMGKTSKIYNLEYYLNRMYALNRDRMKCRICGLPIIDGDDFHTHHISKKLPLNEINRVGNLMSTHNKCNWLIHGMISSVGFSAKAIAKAEKYRKKLLD